ncbi:hypothetical protein BDK51DRAFT_47053 [Blyttiomyces helicus]|uniref:C2H2-type domain-containing protein n=1 Tax=Blyttiomyces helicus TaxID=388810 RepID=A0A4P9W5Z7_9FUNG|nr:hypothetical protein BDK51DRAFT_47053 [Blyttiomyces helicus]|eukprot:RKO86338.1 hypothetical protein BDK51DRAFT_47053 [Blyttiomyces helicus]
MIHPFPFPDFPSLPVSRPPILPTEPAPSAGVVTAFSSAQRCPYEGCMYETASVRSPSQKLRPFEVIGAAMANAPLSARRACDPPTLLPSLRRAGTTFRRKHDLLRHIRSLHVVEKPHECEDCDLSYSRADGVC